MEILEQFFEIDPVFPTTLFLHYYKNDVKLQLKKIATRVHSKLHLTIETTHFTVKAMHFTVKYL